MFLESLEDAYERGTTMGVFAENNVKKFGFTQEDQDAYAIGSALTALLMMGLRR